MIKIDYSKLTVGDVVFVSGTSWISNMIKVVETGKANPEKHFAFVPSHVGVIRDIFEEDGAYLAEVVFKGKRLDFNLMNYINKGSRVVIKRLKSDGSHYSQFSVVKAVEHIVQDVNVRGYDWPLIASYLIRFSIRKIWRWKNSWGFSGFLNSKKQFICSEYVASFLGKLEIYTPDFPTPWDLWRKLEVDTIDYKKEI